MFRQQFLLQYMVALVKMAHFNLAWSLREFLILALVWQLPRLVWTKLQPCLLLVICEGLAVYVKALEACLLRIPPNSFSKVEPISISLHHPHQLSVMKPWKDPTNTLN